MHHNTSLQCLPSLSCPPCLLCHPYFTHIFDSELSKYTYLGVDFTSNGAWDEHVKRVLQNGRKTISQVHSRLLLIFVRDL